MIKLFLSNLYISAFTFGGGLVIVTFMKKKFVDELHFIDEEEMLDFIALAQSSPGVIAVNTSILVGLKIGGMVGMIVSILATIIPPMLILSLITFFYSIFVDNIYIAIILKGMRCGVAAVIIDVVIKLFLNILKTKNPLQIFVIPVAFILNIIFKVNIIFIIIAAIIIGIISASIMKKRSKK